MFQKLPSTLDETIVCGVMMLSIHPMLALIDKIAAQEDPIGELSAKSADISLRYVLTPKKQKDS